MRQIRHALLAFCAAALSAPAAVGAPLAPAAPQPDAAALVPGLAVRYAYPPEVRDLSVARDYLASEGAPGAPLVGLDYPDQAPGTPALTSERAERVAAEIEGYIRFDRPGTWRLQFWSNDGVEIEIGAERVYRHDGRHACETLGWTEVTAPEAGWYPLRATWFQRLNTSCLMLRWQPPGGAEEWAPVQAYARPAP